MNNKIRFLKFGAVGVVNTAVDFIVFVTLVRWLHWNPLLANSASYTVAVSNSYVLNLLWTFRKRDGARLGLRSFVIFVSVNSVGFLIGSAVIWKLQSLMMVEAAKLIAIAVTLIWNFFGTKYFVIDRRK